MDNQDEILSIFLRDKELEASWSDRDGHGAGIDAVVLATATLAPFVAAVAASLGNKVGEGINEALLRILRRLPRPAILYRHSLLSSGLRRDGDDEGLPSEEELRALTVSTESGSRIQISTHTPDSAYSILLDIDFRAVHDIGDVPTTVRWIHDSWHAVSMKDGQIVLHRWDAATRRWKANP